MNLSVLWIPLTLLGTPDRWSSWHWRPDVAGLGRQGPLSWPGRRSFWPGWWGRSLLLWPLIWPERRSVLVARRWSVDHTDLGRVLILRHRLPVHQLCPGRSRNPDLLGQIHGQTRHDLDGHGLAFVLAKEMALLEPVQHINDGRIVGLDNVIVDDESVTL